VYDAVLLDLDDTLVDQASAAAAAVVAWAGHDREPASHAELVARWSEISAHHYHRYQQRELSYVQQRRERVRDLLDPGLGDAEADAAFDDYRRHYDAACAPFPDALPALRRFRALGLRVGVLTNGEADRQLLKAEQAGVAEHLDVLVASSTLPASKPHPSAFLTACEQLGAGPARTLMVGDSLAHDIHGAHAAGLPAVLLDRHDAHQDAGVRRVRSLDELVVVAD
jgi:putative hydrolase of the HAD superfamily